MRRFSKCHPQSGFGLLGALLALMVMGAVAVYMTSVANFFSNVSTLSSKMNSKQKMTVLRDLLIQSAKDIDSDQNYELLKPTADNKIPTTISLSAKDEFGTDFRFCAYDLGDTNTIDAVNYISSNPAFTSIHISGWIISAGPDKTFQTSCSDSATSGDDAAITITEHDIRFTNGGLGGWKDEGTNISTIVTSDNVKLKTNLLTIGNFASLPSTDPDGNAIDTGTVAFYGDDLYVYTSSGWRKSYSAGASANQFMIPVPATTLPDGTSVPAFNVMQFEAKQVGMVPTSQPSQWPWVDVHYDLAKALCQGIGMRLIKENEWLAIAHNVVQQGSNWTGGSVGSGQVFIGHTDASPYEYLQGVTWEDGYYLTGQAATNAQRRILYLSNGKYIWDFSGNVWEWVDQTIASASRYHGGTSEWMSYNSNDGTGKVASNVPLNKLPPPGWTANQGMGRYYDGYSASGAYNNVTGYCTGYCDSTAAFVRGGDWVDGTYAGVFALYLNGGRGHASSGLGFRCTSN